MNTDQSSNDKKPDVPTGAHETEETTVESLPDGSQSDGSAESDADTASGGPAD